MRDKQQGGTITERKFGESKHAADATGPWFASSYYNEGSRGHEHTVYQHSRTDTQKYLLSAFHEPTVSHTHVYHTEHNELGAILNAKVYKMAESCFFWSLIPLYFCLWMLSSCSSSSCAIRISLRSACRICSFPPVSSHLHRPTLPDTEAYKKKKKVTLGDELFWLHANTDDSRAVSEGWRCEDVWQVSCALVDAKRQAGGKKGWDMKDTMQRMWVSPDGGDYFVCKKQQIEWQEDDVVHVDC